jgi:hypothetical protein
MRCILIAILTLIATPSWAEPLPMDEVAPGVFVHHGIHEELDAG